MIQSKKGSELEQSISDIFNRHGFDIDKFINWMSLSHNRRLQRALKDLHKFDRTSVYNAIEFNLEIRNKRLARFRKIALRRKEVYDGFFKDESSIKKATSVGHNSMLKEVMTWMDQNVYHN